MSALFPVAFPRSLRNLQAAWRAASGEGGQSIVLFALTAFALALVMISTFAVGVAYKEKISIQQAADAAAYSQAVQEARAMNYYALTNRAAIGHYVAEMSIYGHSSYLTYYANNVETARELWEQISFAAADCCAAILPICTCVFPGCCPCDASGCCNLIDPAANNADLYRQEYDRVRSTGWCPDCALDQAVSQSADMNVQLGAVALRDSQEAVDRLLVNMVTQGTLASAIAKGFDTAYQPAAAVGSTNGDFWNSTRVQRDGIPGYVMVAHNARPETNPFMTKRNWANTAWTTNFFNQGLRLQEYPLAMTLTTVPNVGQSRTIKASPRISGAGDPQLDGDESKVGSFRAGAHDHGHVTAFFLPGAAGAAPLCTSVASAPGFAGQDVEAWASSQPPSRSGSRHHWLMLGGGVQDEDNNTNHTAGLCPNNNDCGVYAASAWFKTENSAWDNGVDRYAADHVTQNQPRALALLSKNFAGPPFPKRVWEMKMGIYTPTGTANFDTTPASPEHPVVALAMGLAYYHRTDDWQEIPNMLNPFWRAKLHKLGGGERDLSRQCDDACMKGVLGALSETNNGDQQMLVQNGGLPLPF